jgi:hypothetical protein
MCRPIEAYKRSTRKEVLYAIVYGRVITVQERYLILYIYFCSLVSILNFERSTLYNK